VRRKLFIQAYTTTQKTGYSVKKRRKLQIRQMPKSAEK